MTEEADSRETLFMIEVDATAVSAPNYIRGDTHAMLAFTEACKLDDAYIAVYDALKEEGWRDISFGRIKNITGNVPSISDETVREHAERAYTHKVSILIYTPPRVASKSTSFSENRG